MPQYLKLLLSHFVVLQYKFHTIHTNARWPEFLWFHEFMWDLYKMFWDDNIDWIKERALILWMDTPCSLAELLSLCKIPELKEVPSIPECWKIVYDDLVFIEQVLQKWIDISWEENDLVTQNTLIDRADAVWKNRRKLSFTFWL